MIRRLIFVIFIVPLIVFVILTMFSIQFLIWLINGNNYDLDDYWDNTVIRFWQWTQHCDKKWFLA